MATRFGAAASNNNNTKVFWLVGCGVTLFAVLLITFVIISQNKSEPADAGQVPAIVEPVIQPTNSTKVLVPQGRIEEGARLEAIMFTTLELDADKVPFGAVREKDLEQVVGKFAKKILSPNEPLVLEDITETKSINLISIPPGYRAVTIQVDSRSGVEGFAKPNSRVDVLWTFTQDGQQKVSTLVRFTKVLSVGGLTAADSGKAEVGGATTVTLLVTEKDAKKIELARTLGTLSLSLVGDQEDGVKDNEPDVIDIGTLLNTPKSSPNSNSPAPVEPADGYMETVDPKTGRKIKYVYHKSTRKWSVDRSSEAGSQ